MAVLFNLSFDYGEDWVVNHTAFQSDGATPFDVNGATYELLVVSGSTVVVPANAWQVDVIEPSGGQATLTLPASAQTGLSALNAGGIYNYTLRLILRSGVVTDQNYGTLNAKSTAFSMAGID